MSTPFDDAGLDDELQARINRFALDREGSEPGFDVHEWESTWVSIDEDADDDPDAALSQFADLVERVLAATGYTVTDPVARQGEEPEVVVTYLAARDTAERAELGTATRSEVEQANADLRAIFDSLLAELRTA
jgi:hypothetical protein